MLTEIDPFGNRPEVLRDLLFGAGNINYAEYDFGLGNLPEGPLDAEPLDLVGRGADAGRVDEAEEDAADHAGLFDRVAGGAGDVGDDGAVVAEQGIEQGALAAVRRADDGDGHAVADGVAQAEGVGKLAAVRAGGIEQRAQPRAVGELDVLLAEVQLQFQQRRELQQLFAQLAQFGGIAAAKLIHRDAMLCFRRR